MLPASLTRPGASDDCAARVTNRFRGLATAYRRNRYACLFASLLVTLGYGDVVPASEPAQGLAIVEGVSGQMYLAVLVARLVSLYAQQRES